MLFPNCTINIDPGPGNMSVDVTRPAGPGRCAGSTEYFFYPEVPEETAEEMMAFANQVGTEDASLVASVQVGLSSGMIRTGACCPRARSSSSTSSAWCTTPSVATDPKHAVLFEPLQIGPKTLQEPLLPGASLHGLRRAEAGRAGAASLHEAEGGWAAVNTEYCAVSPDSDETPFISARLWDDGDLRALSLMCDGCTSMARSPAWSSTTRASTARAAVAAAGVGPSQLASDYLLVTPKAMERDDIGQITQEDWAAAAAAGARRGIRHRLRLRGARLPAHAVSRRSTTGVPTSTAARSRTALRFWMNIELTQEAVEGGSAPSRRASPSPR